VLFTTTLLQITSLFFLREISEMRGPTGVKFYTMVSTKLVFITPV